MWYRFKQFAAPGLIGAMILLSQTTLVHAVTVRGRVLDSESGQPLAGATVRLAAAGQVTQTDSTGTFVMPGVPDGRYELTASYMGYTPTRIDALLSGDESQVELRLDPTVLPGEEIVITTTRVSAQTDAVSHSNITREDIERDYTVEDVPMFLSNQPGVYAYSDAGNGVGYSYMQIRGFNQQKISVLVNGVPHNDPESHQVYWVDVPDMLESASDIQVQRGVGASLYGASAAGGVVSMEVNPFTQDPRLSFNFGYGSYNTRKFMLEGRSGLINDRYSVYGRYSRIVSDGYREQSWVDQWSYFVGVARFDKNLSNRFHAYGGPERLHLAYYGIDPPTLDTNRRFNPLVYEHETDDFNQPHYELLTDWKISEKLTLNNSLFYIKGDGFYIQSDPWSSFADLELNEIQTRDSLAYDPWRYETAVVDTTFEFDATDNKWHETINTTLRRDTLPSGDTVFTVNQSTDAVLQRWVKNQFFGMAPRFSLEHGGGTLLFGGSLDRHHGYHFGQVRSASPAPAGFLAGEHYYDYDGYRSSAIAFVQENWRGLDRLNLSLGLQFQWRRYSLRNDRRGGVSYDVDYTSLSPRLGAVLRITPVHLFYANASLARHEPAHDDIFKPRKLEDPTRYFRNYDPVTGVASDPFMRAEKVTNLELGYRLRSGRARLDLNGFYLWFADEIVAEGGIDLDGNPVRTNAGQTIHRGVEALFRVKPVNAVEVTANATWSDNYFEEFTQYFEVSTSPESNDTVFLAAASTDSVSYAGNPIAGFPEVMFNVGLYLDQPVAGRTHLLAGIDYRYVGRIYLDNTGNQALSIEPFNVLNLRLGLRAGGLGIGQAYTLELLVNNATDKLYEASGYTWGGVPYFYVAAERNYYLRLRTSW